MSPLIESNIHGVWAAKQSAKGTPATTATQRFKLAGGSSPTGVIANTTPGVNATHTFAPQNGLGFWSTWWQTVGAGVKQQLKNNDVRMGGVQIEASSGTKDLRASPQFLGLDPAEQYVTDQTLGMPTSPVLLFTEGAGNFQVDSTTILAMSQFQIQLAYNIGPVFGDNVTPYDIARGTPTAVVTCTAEADDVMIGRWNNWLAPNPTQGSGQMSLTGAFRLLGSNPLYSMSVGCQSAAFTG
jgi:hypothetical protein